MFDAGDIIDGKYRVAGLCSDSGGMGTILDITPLDNPPPYRLVLKYCKEDNEETLKRFRREVRVLSSFKGNSKVVAILDRNLDHDPPYFVMKYYGDGDLSKRSARLRGSLAAQEQTFLQMIDCVHELHSRSVFHRDIKPQNFLVDGDQIVISDFGLTKEVGSDTAFTRSSVYGGTLGYLPPEYLIKGGFKHADAEGDIFMLGKTMYVLLTDRDPMYLVGDELAAPVFHVIERCCSISKTHRYHTLAELKQSLVAAYDVILGRAGGIGKVKQLLSSIKDRLEQEHKYSSREVIQFIEQLALLDEVDQMRICFELPGRIFRVIRHQPVIGHLQTFLTIYEKLVEGRDYSWSYAETIANNMQTLFEGDDVPFAQKAQALDLAIRAAYYMNRFAAMDTCEAMIIGIRDETLGLHIASVLLQHKDTFVSGIEISKCESESIRNAFRQIQAEKEDPAEE